MYGTNGNTEFNTLASASPGTGMSLLASDLGAEQAANTAGSVDRAHASILIDLSSAYDANVPSLPDIETAVNQLLRAAGRTVSVTVLRESQELVYSAIAANLLTAIQTGGEEGEYLKAAFLAMAAPDRDVAAPDLCKLRNLSTGTQDIFMWICNYRRQRSFDPQKLNTLLFQIDSIQTTQGQK